MCVRVCIESQPDLAPEVLAILRTGYLEFLSLVQSDPPDHTRIRAVFNKAFAAPRIAALEPYVREVANDLIDSFIAEGEVDIVDHYAFPLPGVLICKMLGIPRSELPAGARVFLLYGSGNRDEDQFPKGDVFDIHRVQAAQHLSFGKGLHFCVGSLLAKLEGRVAIELALKRLPNLRRHATLPWERRPYVLLRGFEHLPVQWDAPARS